MIEAGTILDRLYNHLLPHIKDRRIAELRIGLSYVGVLLDNRAAGIAAVLPESSVRSCTVLKEAGTYIGSSAVKTLEYLIAGKSALYRAIGLATANTIYFPKTEVTENREATTYLNIQANEKVAMVGLFGPLVERIRKTGAMLTIIEKNPQRLELLSQEDKQRALKECDVAIITATTLLNNTFEETIALLGTPRSVVLMGPSTPLVPEIFQDTPVTHLGGAVVADAAEVLQIISEGGGTPALRPHLRFLNLIKNI
jgi:hypothetical protein